MIELTHCGRVAVMTIAHGKANALDIELCNAIIRRFAELSAAEASAVEAPAAEAVVVTGQGGIFSAGVDLVRATAGGADYLRELLPVLSQAFAAVFFHPKPVVAAVNGHAIAGGCVLACAADRRLMGRNGRIGVTELLVGVPFPAVAFEIMRFVAVPHRFAEIMFGAATYAPDTAQALGLVDEIVESDLIDRAVAAAEQLAALSPQAFALTKQQTRQSVQERLARDGARVDAAVHEIWLRPDTLARMRDYVARTLKK
jgi:enoyl-CoA hydratase